VEIPITSLRVQIAVFQTPSTQPAPVRSYVDNVAGIFCRPWGSGRTMVGLGGGDQHDPIDPDCCNPQNDSAFPAAARSAMGHRFPSFADSVYLHGHAGMYDMTPDAHPIIGPAGPNGLIVAAGFSGAGFKKAPAIGEAIADTILSESIDWADLSAFDISRFATDAWKQPWSPNEYALASDFGHGF
jgi:glycine/D-amino acid oxidase-like deaminating enzyme